MHLNVNSRFHEHVDEYADGVGQVPHFEQSATVATLMKFIIVRIRETMVLKFSGRRIFKF